MAFSSKTVLNVVVFATVLYFLKQYMNGPSCNSKARLDGKIAIVTGANTGVGKYTALDFVQRGAKVYLACRSEERGNEAALDIISETGVNKEKVVVKKLDLSSLQSVREFAESFKTLEKKLDILVNNAGIMFADGKTTVDGFEETFAINHLGHFLLTNLLLDHLKASQKSRIVNVSSKAHIYAYMNFDDLHGKKGYSHFFAYGQSKLANILFTKELAERLKGTGVTTYAVHPGTVTTELARNLSVYKVPITQLFGRLVTWPFFKDTWYGAQTQICCAVSEELTTETGKYYENCREEEPAERAKDLTAAKTLWEISEKLTKLHQRSS